MLKHLIFDWSGTLADDAHLTWRATNQTLIHFGGAEVSLDEYRREFRMPVDRFYGPRLPGVSMAAVDEYFFARLAEGEVRGPLFPDADLLLRYACINNFTVFILSSLKTSILEDAVAALRITDCFEKIHGSAYDKMEALPALLREHGLAPDETLYVGDTPHDVESAHHARVQSGAALYGYSGAAALRAESPDHEFESPAGILHWLQKKIAIERTPRPIATVGGLIFNDRGEILLARTEKWNRLYGTPGGKIDYGESMADAFRREIREETGLEIEDVEFATLDEGIESQEFREPRHFLFVNFRARVKGAPAARPNYESTELLWIPPQDALALPLNTPTRDLIEKELRR